MIKVFYGEDRIKARAAVERILGKDYEVVDAEDNLTAPDMASLFLGTTLFAETRNILLKNLDANKECWDELPKYFDTPHNVVIWNATLDKRTVTGKAIAAEKAIETKEFAKAVEIDRGLAFDIIDMAMSGDMKAALVAVKKLEAAKSEPYALIGSFTWQLVEKKLKYHNSKAPKALKILAKADLDMKEMSDISDPWILIKKAIIEIASL